MNKPICIGITGGIGSGKSFVCSKLESKGIPIFYTDIEAKKEMRENPWIHAQLHNIIGKSVVNKQGLLIKAVIADYICRGQEYADRINAIVHPKVKERLIAWLQASCDSIVGVECALLFESGLDSECHKVLTVMAPEPIRIKRIMQRDDISREKALEWITLQMPQENKAAHSDYTIVNDGICDIDTQINEILGDLTNKQKA